MAWAHVGLGGATGNTTDNQASIVHTVATTALGAGQVGVLIIAVDNNQTTDGDEGAVSGVVDSTGANTWAKAAEFTNGQGGAQAGATVSVWWTKAASQVAIGGTITASFTNSASRDESACLLRVFSVAAGSSISVAATATAADDGGTTVTSLNPATANTEHLRVRAIATEHNNNTALTPTASGGWAAFGVQRSANVATAQAIRGEYAISTGTGNASQPTMPGTAGDHASVYIAFLETAASGIAKIASQHIARMARA